MSSCGIIWRKLERKLQKTKRKKLRNLSKNAEIKKLALARFREHLPHFKFKVDFTSFRDNIHNILTLDETNSSKNEHHAMMSSFKLLKIT